MTLEALEALNAKLSKLEIKHQSLQKRQDKIDSLALNTLDKMEILTSKMKTIRQLTDPQFLQNKQNDNSKYESITDT